METNITTTAQQFALAKGINRCFNKMPFMAGSAFVKLDAENDVETNLCAVLDNLAEIVVVLESIGERYNEMEAELSDYRRTHAGLRRALGIESS